jgi:hypothetical protein
MSVVASMGLLHLWDMDEGCAVLDPFSYSQEDFIVAGSFLGVGEFVFFFLSLKKEHYLILIHV